MFTGLNKNKFLSGLIALSLVFLISCGEPKVDASSSKAIKISIDDIRESLSIEQLALFNSSLRMLTIKYSKLHKSLNSESKLLKIIDGKTGLEIIEIARNIRSANPL